MILGSVDGITEGGGHRLEIFEVSVVLVFFEGGVKIYLATFVAAPALGLDFHVVVAAPKTSSTSKKTSRSVSRPGPKNPRAATKKMSESGWGRWTPKREGARQR
jgi:hypothetical protein